MTTETSQPHSHTIQIIGESYAPLLAAIALKKQYPLEAQIEVLSSRPENTQKLTSTGNYFREFHNWLGINEYKFIRQTKADLQYAIEIKNNSDTNYFSECPTGFMLNNTRFQHLFNYASEQSESFDNFNLGIAIHKEGRFTPPSNNNKSIFHQLTYGYIFNDETYYDFLYTEAQSLGISITPRTSPQKLTADLKIVTDAPRKYSRALFDGITRETNYTKATTRGSAIQLAPELKHKVQHKGVRESRIYSTDASRATFGHQEQSFDGKTLLLGSAYADLPGLIIDPVFLLQSQLMSLCKLSRLTTSAAQAQIFNRNSQRQIHSLAEIDEAIIYASNLGNIKYTPETLHRIRLFSTSGSITQSDGSCMTESTWLSLLYAILDRPKSFPAAVEALALNDMRQKLAQVKKTISEAANKPPLYANFINSIQKDN